MSPLASRSNYSAILENVTLRLRNSAFSEHFYNNTCKFNFQEYLFYNSILDTRSLSRISEYETFLKKSATVANRDSSEIPSRLSAIKKLANVPCENGRLPTRDLAPRNFAIARPKSEVSGG